MRVFIGIGLPEPVTRSLAAIQSGLSEANWVAPENFHVTLRFIGETNRFRLDDLDAALADIEAPAFDLSVDGLGCFERRGSAHALWAGLKASEELGHLQAKVARAVTQAGFAEELRKFKPHITLARFKRIHMDRLAQYISGNNHEVTGTFHVGAFTLYQSHLLREGPHYEALRSYPLVDYEALWPEAEQKA